MESYTDMKYSDCGCSGRCRKVSGNRNQSVRSCLDPAMQAGSGVRYPQMGNQMNDGMPQMIPETGNNWENNGNFGWNRMPGLEGNAFCPGSMPGMLEKDYPLAMELCTMAGQCFLSGMDQSVEKIIPGKEPSFQSWTWPLIKGGAAR